VLRVSRRVLAANSTKHAPYPEEFVRALTDAGWLSALIPEEYAGPGWHHRASIIEEVNRSGATRVPPCADVHHGHAVRPRFRRAKVQYLPDIAAGRLRLQSFRGDRPTTGFRYHQAQDHGGFANGENATSSMAEVWTSRVQTRPDVALARTTPLDQVQNKSDGLSVFLVDLRASGGKGVTVRPIRNMPNHETNEVFLDNLEVPAANLIGEEGKGFRYISTA